MTTSGPVVSGGGELRRESALVLQLANTHGTILPTPTTTPTHTYWMRKSMGETTLYASTNLLILAYTCYVHNSSVFLCPRLLHVSQLRPCQLYLRSQQHGPQAPWTKLLDADPGIPPSQLAGFQPNSPIERPNCTRRSS